MTVPTLFGAFAFLVVLFPAVTAVPAFLGAFVAAAVLQRLPRRTEAG